MSSTLFILRAWQSSRTTSLQVLFGLALGIGPSTSYSIHFFTQSSSFFRSWLARNNAACSAAIPMLCHLYLVSPSTLYLGVCLLVCIEGTKTCHLGHGTFSQSYCVSFCDCLQLTSSPRASSRAAPYDRASGLRQVRRMRIAVRHVAPLLRQHRQSIQEYDLILLIVVFSSGRLLCPFDGLFSRTTWVSRYQKGKTSLDLNDARDDRVLGWIGGGISWTMYK